MASQLQPSSIARQDSYAEFLNATFKAIQQSQSRLILRSKNDEASQILLPDVERELEKQYARVTDLTQTYALQSSDEVKKAAGPIAMYIGALRMFSWLPDNKQKFDEILAN